jgi:hypothetical protein
MTYGNPTDASAPDVTEKPDGNKKPETAGEEGKPVTPPPVVQVPVVDVPGNETNEHLDLAAKGQEPAAVPPPAVEKVSQLDTAREGVRGDLARGLLWLLTLLIGGLLVFVGIGRVLPEVLTQSVFPSLVTLTGTALGFYFGSQSSKDSNK